MASADRLGVVNYPQWTDAVGFNLTLIVMLALLGWLLLVGSFWLAARWAPGVAAVVNGVGLVGSLVLGAGELGAGLWPYAPWAWAHLPASLGWGTTAVILVVAVGVGSALTPLAIAAMRWRAVEP